MPPCRLSGVVKEEPVVPLAQPDIGMGLLA